MHRRPWGCGGVCRVAEEAHGSYEEARGRQEKPRSSQNSPKLQKKLAGLIGWSLGPVLDAQVTGRESAGAHGPSRKLS